MAVNVLKTVLLWHMFMCTYKLGFILSGKAQEFEVGGDIVGCTYYNMDDNTE